jgi:hypothetical protein
MSTIRIKQRAYEGIEKLIESIGSESELNKVSQYSVKLNALTMTMLAMNGPGSESMTDVNARKSLQDKITVLISALLTRVNETEDDEEGLVYSQVLEAASRAVIVLQGRRSF